MMKEEEQKQSRSISSEEYFTSQHDLAAATLYEVVKNPKKNGGSATLMKPKEKQLSPDELAE